LIELIVYKHGNICIDWLATPLMAVHFDDESWRGGGYDFCLSRPSVRSVFCGCTLLYYTVGEYSVKFLLLWFSLTENGDRT
jgi:hypothetical protein